MKSVTNLLSGSVQCVVCGSCPKNVLQCSRCKGVKYCSAVCQKLDWPEHKVNCKATAECIRILDTARSDDRSLAGIRIALYHFGILKGRDNVVMTVTQVGDNTNIIFLNQDPHEHDRLPAKEGYIKVIVKHSVDGKYISTSNFNVLMFAIMDTVREDKTDYYSQSEQLALVYYKNVLMGFFDGTECVIKF